MATLTDEKQQAETRADKAEEDGTAWVRREGEARMLAQAAEKERDEQRERADTAEANLARQTAEKRDAMELAGKAEGLVVHARLSAERKAAEKQQDEAARAAERQALEQRAGDAEGRVRELEARQVQPLALTEKQRPMLEDVCARNGIEGDIGNDARAQLLAWAAHHEERDKAREARKRREAEAKEAAALAEKERVEEAVRLAREDERGKAQVEIDTAVRLALEAKAAREQGAEREEGDHDGRGTGEAAVQNGRGGRAAGGDRGGGGDEGDIASIRPAAAAGGDGDRGAARGSGVGDEGSAATPASSVEPGLVADRTPRRRGGSDTTRKSPSGTAGSTG